jgi:hypothetical protein
MSGLSTSSTPPPRISNLPQAKIQGNETMVIIEYAGLQETVTLASLHAVLELNDEAAQLDFNKAFIGDHFGQAKLLLSKLEPRHSNLHNVIIQHFFGIAIR